jgi:putative ABC transport system permease protein
MLNTSAWNETVLLALQALQANKMRAALTILGVIIGSAAIVLVITASLAGKRYVISEIEAVGSNLVQAEMISPGESESLVLADRLTPGDLEAIRHDIAQVRQVAGTNDVRMNVTVAGDVRPIGLVGVTEEFNEIRRLVVVKGRYFDHEDMTWRSKVCLITEQLASLVFPYEDPLGKYIAIGELRFTVIGVFRERAATFGLTEIADESAIIPFPLIKDYVGSDYFKTLYAQADSPEDVPVVTRRVAGVLLARHRHSAKYRVWNLAGILEAARNISRALTVSLIIVALIALTISGIGIMNIMLVTVTERTREIGIRKAIGAPNSAILYQFLTEAMLISGTGSLVGIALGTAVPFLATVLLQLTAVADLLGGTDMSHLTIPISWLSVVLAFVVSCSTGLVFGYLPASRASKLDPAESLRFE